MKKLTVFVLIVMFAPAMHALYFDISAPLGEPLSAGDPVEVFTTTPSPGHNLSHGRFDLYYSGDFIGTVWFDNFGALVIDGYGFVSGSKDLMIGMYDWADSMTMYLYTSFPPYQYEWPANNFLDVLPTDEPLPTMNTWGLIFLLVAVSTLIIWKR